MIVINKACLVGRLTRDPELRYSTGENAVAFAKFSVAVQRKFKNKEGEYEADFINCTAMGKTAEFVEKYFSKGNAIGLTGEIRTGNYINKEGIKVYTTEVFVDSVEFVESKKNKEEYESPDIFEPVDDDDELPFA